MNLSSQATVHSPHTNTILLRLYLGNLLPQARTWKRASQVGVQCSLLNAAHSSPTDSPPGPTYAALTKMGKQSKNIRRKNIHLQDLRLEKDTASKGKYMWNDHHVSSSCPNQPGCLDCHWLLCSPFVSVDTFQEEALDKSISAYIALYGQSKKSVLK